MQVKDRHGALPKPTPHRWRGQGKMDLWFGPLRQFLHLPQVSCCPLPGLTPNPARIQAEDANGPKMLHFAHTLCPLTHIRIWVSMKFLKCCTEGDQPHTKHGGKAVTEHGPAEFCHFPKVPTYNSPKNCYQRPLKTIFCLKKLKAFSRKPCVSSLGLAGSKLNFILTHHHAILVTTQ